MHEKVFWYTCTVRVGLLCLKTRSHTCIVPEVDEVKNTAGLVGLQQPSVNGDSSYLTKTEYNHTYHQTQKKLYYTLIFLDHLLEAYCM